MPDVLVIVDVELAIVEMAHIVHEFVIAAVDPGAELRVGRIGCQHVELHRVVTYGVQVVDVVSNFGVLGADLLVDVRVGEYAPEEDHAAEPGGKHQTVDDRLRYRRFRRGPIRLRSAFAVGKEEVAFARAGCCLAVLDRTVTIGGIGRRFRS